MCRVKIGQYAWMLCPDWWSICRTSSNVSSRLMEHPGLISRKESITMLVFSRTKSCSMWQHWISMNVASFLDSYCLCIFLHCLSVESHSLSYVYPLHHLACLFCLVSMSFPFPSFLPSLLPSSLFLFPFYCGVETKVLLMLSDNSTTDPHINFYVLIFNSTQRLYFYFKLCKKKYVHLLRSILKCVFVCLI